MYYKEGYTAPVWNFDADAIKKYEEKQQLKKRCNFVGIMIIISTFAFLLLSVMAAFIYGFVIANEIISPSDFFTEAYDSIFLNIMTGFCNITAIGICGAVFIKKLRIDNPDNLPFEKIGVKKLFALCAIGFTVCNLSNYLTNLFLNAAYSFGIDLNLENISYDSNSVFEIIVYLISVAVVPAFSEELLFRGAVLSSLRKYGDGVAVFVSSLFFGIFHGNFIQFPFAFIVGLVLSFAVVYTNSLLPAMLIHFMNNGYSVVCDVLTTNMDRWNLNENIVYITNYAFVIVVAVIAVISLVKLSRKDKEFLKLKPNEGLLERKEIKKTMLASPAMIIAFLLLLGETVLSHISV